MNALIFSLKEMTHAQAIGLIDRLTLPSAEPQRWADLGCGAGTFTDALADLLPAGSIVYAVDKAPQRLSRVNNLVTVAFAQLDFEKSVLPYTHLDGILLANALHYCSDPSKVIDQLLTLQATGQEHFLFVEYDTTTSNRWVPYPLPFTNLARLFQQKGFTRIEKLAERPSVYRKDLLYSCQIRR